MGDVLTYVGEEWVVDKLVAGGNVYVGWGTGGDTADKGDTALSTEAAESRSQITPTKTGSGTSAKYSAIGTITCAGSGKTITNSGILSQSSGGSLYIFSTFTGIALNVGDSIQFTFTLDPV